MLGRNLRFQESTNPLVCMLGSSGGSLHEFTHFHYFIQPPHHVATHTHEREFCEVFDYLLEVVQVEEKEDLGWWRRSPRNPLR